MTDSHAGPTPFRFYELPAAEVYEAPGYIGKMTLLVNALLWSLSGDQHNRIQYPMSAPERLDWDFVPKPDRAGVPLWELNKHQRTLLHTLLAHSLSLRGYTQALQIMAMENVLRELEVGFTGTAAGELRHQDGYYLSIYGRPAMEDTWGWRFLGHHLSLSYTIVGERYVAVTPCNMGAQPATAGVLSPLGEDDRLGFQLLDSLNPAQRKAAVIHDVAPADFAARQVPYVGAVEYPDRYDIGVLEYQISDADREALRFVRDEPSGIAGSELDEVQAEALIRLVDCYLGRFPEAVSLPHRRRLERHGLAELFFSWAGGEQPGTSHYYRVHGPSLLIEFDNAIDNGNHIHSNWRDLDNDLGHDLLLDHYQRELTTGHHLTSRLQSSVPNPGPARATSPTDIAVEQ